MPSPAIPRLPRNPKHDGHLSTYWEPRPWVNEHAVKPQVSLAIIITQQDPKTADIWLTAQVAGKAQLGAYVLGSTGNGSNPILTIFWRGYVKRWHLQNALKTSEFLLMQGNANINSILIAFGPEKAIFNHHGPGLDVLLRDKSPVAEYMAFRIELSTNHDKLILWANIKDSDHRDLNDAGENVGICTSRALFEGGAWRLFVDTIQATRQDLNPEMVEILLEKIAMRLRQIWDSVPEALHSRD